MNLLFLMTTGMSLQKWDELGQLSREMNIYQKLGEKIGHVYIFSYGKDEPSYVEKYPNISVISKWEWIPEPPRGNKYFIVLYQILSLMFRKHLFKKMDFIKTNQLNGANFGLKIKNKFDKKLFIRMGYYHTLDKSRFDSEKKYNQQIDIEKKLFSKAEVIFVTKEEAKDFIQKKYTVDHVHYLPNSIDTDIFKPMNIKKDIDVLYVGRLSHVKNLDILLQSLKETKHKVVFIGKGELKQSLQNYAHLNKINLKIIDKVDNLKLPKYYNRAKIFTLISKWEGNPKTLLEAMACGCACIGSNVNGINNVIEHGETGYLCEPNTKSLQEAIDKLINNKSEREILGRNARKFIINNYSLDKIVEKEISIYKKLLD